MKATETQSGRQVLWLDLREGVSDEQGALLTNFDLKFIEHCRAKGKEEVFIMLPDDWPCEVSLVVN